MSVAVAWRGKESAEKWRERQQSDGAHTEGEGGACLTGTRDPGEHQLLLYTRGNVVLIKQMDSSI